MDRCAGCGFKSWDADDLEPGDDVCVCDGHLDDQEFDDADGAP